MENIKGYLHSTKGWRKSDGVRSSRTVAVMTDEGVVISTRSKKRRKGRATNHRS